LGYGRRLPQELRDLLPAVQRFGLFGLRHAAPVLDSGWLQADIDSVNRLSRLAMTDVTEGSDAGANRCFDPPAATPCDSRRNCEPKKAPSSEQQGRLPPQSSREGQRSQQGGNVNFRHQG
jgi:hypothetical protein